MGLSVSADDAMWVLVCGVLTFAMIPATVAFYAGRSSRLPSVALYFLTTVAIVTFVWLLAGYTIAFGPNIGKAIGHGGWVGGLDFLAFRNVSGSASSHAFFETIVAAFAVVVVIAAFADRMRFSACVCFVLVWLLVVYAPIVHWMWGGGLLGARGLGAIDLAGGAVVHCTAGIAALAAAFAVGRNRLAAPRPNATSMVVGVVVLWFGWFGFMAGHVMPTGSLVSNVIVNTQIAAAAGLVGWTFLERMRDGAPTPTGAAKGVLAGLVAITPAAGSVRPSAALGIGLIAGLVCPFAAALKTRLDDDDALDVFAIHWVGGVVGMLLTGVFAVKVGLVFTQQFAQVAKQAVAVVVVSAWSFALTFAILKVLDWTVGLAGEHDGAEVAHHGEVAYGEARP
jgi:Amt family ammonium transporter